MKNVDLGRGRMETNTFVSNGSTFVDTGRVKYAMGMAQKDIVTVESVELCPGAVEREEMRRCIEEFYVMSCRCVQVVSSFYPDPLTVLQSHVAEYVLLCLLMRCITFFLHAG